LSYKSLCQWTGDFSAEAQGDGPYGSIGRGAFGEVFKGLAVPPAGAVPGSVAVRLAVKRMDLKVFHKADNITLTAEYVAKLID
jgi:hypothetical protein